MEFFESYGLILIILAAGVGFVMAWGIGANDVANAMGTSVGSKALTIKQAIIIAMIFEFAGAYLAGGEVTSTIRKGIIDSTYFIDIPEYLVLGMISSLLAAGIWLAVASWLGWPVSTTHSIIGAIIGFTATGVSMELGRNPCYIWRDCLSYFHERAQAYLPNSLTVCKCQALCAVLYGISGLCYVACYYQERP